MAERELHDEIVEWMDTRSDSEWDRTVVVIDRARKAAEDCAKQYP